MTRVLAPEERIALFEAAEAALLRDSGHVSIVKFLGGGDAAVARDRWCDALDAVLAELPDGMFLGPDLSGDRPTFAFAGGVTVQIDLWDLRGEPRVDDAWRFLARAGLAPILIDVVADARWGAAWAESLAAEPAGAAPTVNPAREPSLSPWVSERQRELSSHGREHPLGWIVPAGPSEAPWPWFAAEARARRAALTLALGSEVGGTLYRRLEGERSR